VTSVHVWATYSLCVWRYGDKQSVRDSGRQSLTQSEKRSGRQGGRQGCKVPRFPYPGGGGKIRNTTPLLLDIETPQCSAVGNLIRFDPNWSFSRLCNRGISSHAGRSKSLTPLLLWALSQCHYHCLAVSFPLRAFQKHSKISIRKIENRMKLGTIRTSLWRLSVHSMRCICQGVWQSQRQSCCVWLDHDSLRVFPKYRKWMSYILIYSKIYMYFDIQ
jgi:hypothetical protein